VFEVILKWLLEKWNVRLNTGYVCFRIGISGVSLSKGNDISCSTCKICGDSLDWKTVSYSGND